MNILQFEHLAKYHPGGEREYLFSNVSAAIAAPEIVTLLGASGQGKSTLLRILGLLDAPDEGEISFRGKSAANWSPMEWRKKVSYVAQHAVMLPGSVEHNLRTVDRLHGGGFDAGLAQALMESAGLGGMDWKQSAAGLSGGEKQRVALIRSMLLRSEILLLDEVTASLDQQSKQLVEKMLTAWHRREGATLIWITHDLEQAKQISDRVWFMAEGALLEDCKAESFFQSPSTAAGKSFICQPVHTGG